MKVMKLIKKLRGALEDNLKIDSAETNENVAKYVTKALKMLDSDKKEELLSELTKKKNLNISLKIRENHLLRVRS